MAPPSNVAELLLPAIRWDPDRGYESSRDEIAHALAIGVGGFILFGRMLRVGELAGGMFWCGMICVLIGAILAVMGLILRFMARGAAFRVKER